MVCEGGPDSSRVHRHPPEQEQWDDHMEGWRWLAKMLRAQTEARWNRLSDETAAKLSWPGFRDAVIAALEEQSTETERERSSDDTPDEPLSG